MVENGREQWASRWGFILAAMGSAVGLGNIWRFSYAMGEEGGGAAFLIIYLICILAIGFPVMMAEFTIGRRAQSDAVGAFQKLAPGKLWFIAGGMGVLAAFIILSFYGVIGGWSLKYMLTYLTGGVGGDTEAFFGAFTGAVAEPIIWQLIFMAIVIGIVFFGVKKGIEVSVKLLMAILGVLLIVLAVYSLTLGGAAEGLAFMFQPEWEAFANPDVYVMAMGQAFFTLSLGMGAMITYSSYLNPKHRLPSAAGTVIVFDTLFAIVSGLVIFPALFAFGMEPAQGAGLAFVVLPAVFESIGGFGAVVGLLFFLLLTIAAVSSAISLLEVAVAYFIRKLNMNRRNVAVLIGGIIFLVGIPSSLSMGVMADFTILGDPFLDFMDNFSANTLLPLGGLIMALFVGWGWKWDEALEHSDIGNASWGPLFLTVLRYIVPVAIAIVFVLGLIDWLS